MGCGSSYQNVIARNNQNVSKDNATAINTEDQTLQAPLQRGSVHVPSINSAEYQTVQARLQQLHVTGNTRDNSLALRTHRRVSYDATPPISSATPTWGRSYSNITTTLSHILVGTKEMIYRNTSQIGEFDIQGATHIANITDSVFLRDGSLVLCDSKNECLNLFNPDFEFLGRLSLDSQPHNITVISANEIAVSLPRDKAICYVKIMSGLFSDERLDKRFRTSARCRGVACIQGSILYTTQKDVIVHKDDGNETKFPYQFREPVSLTTDEVGGFLFVSCIGLKSFGEVIVMNTNGKIEFPVSGGKISHPVCCTLDRERNIYICDADPHIIHQVSPEGNTRRVLMESQTEKYQHINFLPNEDIFLLTSNDSNTVKFYEMV